jgi:hypothetical protein
MAKKKSGSSSPQPTARTGPGARPTAPPPRQAPPPPPPAANDPPWSPETQERVIEFMRNLRLDGKTATVIYFGLSLIYFLPALLPNTLMNGTDYIRGGFFFYEFIANRLASGSLPKWVPYVYGGLPLTSNPGETYYPPYFLADLILPVSKLFPFIFILQFTLAGVGGYVLARELGCRRWVAFITGLCYQFTGLIMSFIQAGHDGRIIVTTLAPLFFALLHRGVKNGSIAPFLAAAVVLGGTLTSFQIQSNYYMLLAGGIWFVFLVIHYDIYRNMGGLLRRVILGVAMLAIGFSTAAVDFLPFIKYIEASPRGGAGRGYKYSTSWSMPPKEIVGIAVPEQAGILTDYQGESPFKLHTEYTGALVVVLLIVGAYVARRNRYWLFFLGLAAFMFTIAIGGHTPLYKLYYAALPGTTKFRAPSIAFFIVVLSFIAMGALTLEALAEEVEERSRSVRPAGIPRPVFIIAGTIVFTAILAVVNIGGDGSPHDAGRAFGWMRFLTFILAIGATLALWLIGRIQTRAAIVALALVSVIDLGIIDRQFFALRDGGPDVAFAKDDVTEFLQHRIKNAERVWLLPTYGHSEGNYMMRYGIAQIGGEHPNPLQSWYDYVGAGDSTYVNWHNMVDHPAFRRAASVRYLVAGQDITNEGFTPIFRGSAFVYEVDNALPKAYLVPQVVVAPTRDSALKVMTQPTWDPSHTAVVDRPLPMALPNSVLGAEVKLVSYEPDDIVISTRSNQPALLVVSDNYYDGWEATLDNKPVPIIRTNHTMRGIATPAGAHTVTMRYRPANLYLGARISAVTWALLALFGGWQLLLYRRRHRAAPAE